ncbi:mucin-5AC-like [Leptopilina heterotoma]|uniref:mucin-5AC-like n=1 Tax=Leptopilina heterotoma TaxID=63436 RepID=UPI001CA991D2|nr:mucin-5AC-like [Leptopilina heterotoma]
MRPLWLCLLLLPLLLGSGIGFYFLIFKSPSTSTDGSKNNVDPLFIVKENVESQSSQQLSSAHPPSPIQQSPPITSTPLPTTTSTTPTTTSITPSPTTPTTPIPSPTTPTTTSTTPSPTTTTTPSPTTPTPSPTTPTPLPTTPTTSTTPSPTTTKTPSPTTPTPSPTTPTPSPTTPTTTTTPKPQYENIVIKINKIDFNIEKTLIVSNITDTTVQLKWSKPRMSYGNVEYIITGHGKNEIVKSFQDFPEHIVKDLQPGERYTFRVTASGIDFNVESKQIVTKTAIGKPGPPTDLKVSKMKYVRSMIIEWRRPLGSEIITGYNLHIAKNGSGAVQDTQVFDTSDYPKYIYYFEESSEFDITVTSFNTQGTSSSTTVQFTSDPINNGNAYPNSLKVSKIKDTTVYLNWGTLDNVDASGYVIAATKSADENPTVEDFYNILYSPLLPVVGLTPGMEYSFQLYPLNTTDESHEIHTDKKIRTKWPLGKPNNLGGTLTVSVIENSAKLTWKNSPLDVITGYVITTFNANDLSLVYFHHIYDTPVSVKFNVPELKSGNSYAFQVTAFNCLGFSDSLQSNVVRIK